MAAAQEPEKTVRDVTPQGVLRVYQSQTQNFPVVPDADRSFAEIEVLPSGLLKSKEFRIQLFGIEIPSRNKTCTYASGARWACGLRAHAALRNLVRGGSIKCAITVEMGNALIGQCKLGQSDISLSLLEAGWVNLAPHVQDPRYVAAEASAKKKAVGMWNGRPPRNQDSAGG
jgi:endonuclease YncB( thermonuclease family)